MTDNPEHRRLEQWRRQTRALRRVAWDTNSLVYLLNGEGPYAPFVHDLMERTVRGSVQAIISVVVELELLVKPLQERDDQTLEAVELLFQSTPGVALIPVDRLIARQAASIRAATGLGVTDAVVAATAVVSNCDAIVGNDFRFARRFGQIPYHLLAEHAET